MAQVINTNVGALTAQRNLTTSQSSLQVSINRLSSGLRVNSSADDAAGLAVAERILVQIRGMTMDIRNAGDAISIMQVADGGAAQISANLQRMRELAIESANEFLSTDRANLNVEFAALGQEIDRLAKSTSFNSQILLGSNAATQIFTFQIGVDATSNSQITVSSVDLRGTVLGVMDTAGVSGTTFTIAGTSNSNALATLANIDSAINTITTTRAGFGAAINRTEAVISFLNLSVLNQSTSRGRIMDADYAAETSNLSRTTILQQAGMAMLSQANALPQNVLTLLR